MQKIKKSKKVIISIFFLIVLVFTFSLSTFASPTLSPTLMQYNRSVLPVNNTSSTYVIYQPTLTIGGYSQRCSSIYAVNQTVSPIYYVFFDSATMFNFYSNTSYNMLLSSERSAFAEELKRVVIDWITERDGGYNITNMENCVLVWTNNASYYATYYLNSSHDIASDAYNEAFLSGYDNGMTDSKAFENGLLTIFSAPIYALTNIFNFEIFGFSVLSIILFILSLCLIGFVIRMIT